MNVEIVKVTEENRPVLERLLQLHAYDFSEILGSDVDDAGLFQSISFGEWESEDWRYYIIKSNGQLAGFACVHLGSALSGDADVTDMDEFFVMRKYRRQGVGRTVAHKLFDMFPGLWEVREVAPNVAAQSFWRKIIDEYTDGKYEERVLDQDRWRGPVQYFISSGGKQ